jgi:hypothetical protein
VNWPELMMSQEYSRACGTIRRIMPQGLRSKYDPEDFVGDAIVELLMKSVEEDLASRIILIAKRRMIDAFKSPRNKELPLLLDVENTSILGCEENEFREKLIDFLPPTDGGILNLWLEGYSTPEIVKLSGLGLRTVERSLETSRDIALELKKTGKISFRKPRIPKIKVRRCRECKKRPWNQDDTNTLICLYNQHKGAREISSEMNRGESTIIRKMRENKLSHKKHRNRKIYYIQDTNQLKDAIIEMSSRSTPIEEISRQTNVSVRAIHNVIKKNKEHQDGKQESFRNDAGQGTCGNWG